MVKKRNHKSSMKIKKKNVKVRRTWKIDPTTRVHSDDTKYNRAKSKRRRARED